MSEETKKSLEDLPTEVETLNPEDAGQVVGGTTVVIRMDLANQPKPSGASASGAMKTIAAAQTD